MWSGVTSQNYIKSYSTVQSARLFNFPFSAQFSLCGHVRDRFKDRIEKSCAASDIKGKMKKAHSDCERDRQTAGHLIRQRIYGTFEYRHYAIFLSRPTATNCNKHIDARS